MKQVNLVEGVSSSVAGVKYQIFATIVANAAVLGHGTAIGWTSPMLPVLLSDASPLQSGPLSPEISAWIGSLMPLGGMFGTFVHGLLSNYVGSRTSLLWCALPAIIHWALLYFSTETWMLIVARFLGGMSGGGVFICIPMFVAEIASEQIRGKLSSLLSVSFNTGIVLGYIICSNMQLYSAPLLLIAFPLVFFSVFIWLPTTPQALLKQNKPEKAEKSLRLYRNIGADQKGTPRELLMQAELEKFALIAKQNSEMPPVQLSDFSSREAIRGMLIGPALMAVAQFSGTFTLSNYANTIFRESGTSLDPNLSSIVLGSIQVLGTICAATFIDRFGRKVLLLISSAGSAASLLVTGIYAYLNATGYDLSGFSVLPVVSLSFFIFISAVGLSPVPYVLVSEVLPQKIRRIGVTVCVCLVSVFAFIMLRFFPVMLALVGLHGCMLFFTCVSVSGFVFTLVVVKETKGMNLDQVQQVKARRASECEAVA